MALSTARLMLYTYLLVKLNIETPEVRKWQWMKGGSLAIIVN